MVRDEAVARVLRGLEHMLTASQDDAEQQFHKGVMAGVAWVTGNLSALPPVMRETIRAYFETVEQIGSRDYLEKDE